MEWPHERLLRQCGTKSAQSITVMVKSGVSYALPGLLNHKVRPEGCKIYFVPHQDGNSVYADFFTEDGVYIKTLHPNDGGEDFLDRCISHAYIENASVPGLVAAVLR